MRQHVVTDPWVDPMQLGVGTDGVELAPVLANDADRDEIDGRPVLVKLRVQKVFLGFSSAAVDREAAGGGFLPIASNITRSLSAFAASIRCAASSTLALHDS